MRVGEYFGEISLIYECKTTARITARKYCNFATLTKKIFKEVTTQFPGIQDAIQSNIYKYNDKLIRFIRKGLLKIPYFINCKPEVMFDIIFFLKTENYTKNHVLQNLGEDATSLYFM